MGCACANLQWPIVRGGWPKKEKKRRERQREKEVLHFEVRSWRLLSVIFSSLVSSQTRHSISESRLDKRTCGIKGSESSASERTVRNNLVNCPDVPRPTSTPSTTNLEPVNSKTTFYLEFSCDFANSVYSSDLRKF